MNDMNNTNYKKDLKRSVWVDYFSIFIISSISIPTLLVFTGFYLGLPAFYMGVFGDARLFWLVIVLLFLIPVAVGIANKFIFKHISGRVIVFLTAVSLVFLILVDVPLVDEFTNFQVATEIRTRQKIGTWKLLKEFVANSSRIFAVKKYGKKCTYAGQCGNIIAVDCRYEASGPRYPFYYVDKNTGEILEYCGGYCNAYSSTGKYCRNCPPKEWDCE